MTHFFSSFLTKHFLPRMIVSKIRGTHRSIPIGKIKIVYLYETLRYTCSLHAHFEHGWNSISTSNVESCMEFLYFSSDLAQSATSVESGYFIKTLMAILNHKSRLQILSKNFALFTNILTDMQINPNLALVSKCSIYKIPMGTSNIIKTHTTSYYLVFNFAPIVQAQKFFRDLTIDTSEYGRIFSIIISDWVKAFFFHNRVLLSLICRKMEC